MIGVLYEAGSSDLDRFIRGGDGAESLRPGLCNVSDECYVAGTLRCCCIESRGPDPACTPVSDTRRGFHVYIPAQIVSECTSLLRL